MANRKNRTNFTAHQLSVLEKSFTDGQYPDVAVLEQLATTLQLPIHSLATWFQNRRARFRRQCKGEYISWMRKEICGDRPGSNKKSSEVNTTHSVLVLPTGTQDNHLGAAPGANNAPARFGDTLTSGYGCSTTLPPPVVHVPGLKQSATPAADKHHRLTPQQGHHIPTAAQEWMNVPQPTPTAKPTSTYNPPPSNHLTPLLPPSVTPAGGNQEKKSQPNAKNPIISAHNCDVSATEMAASSQGLQCDFINASRGFQQRDGFPTSTSSPVLLQSLTNSTRYDDILTQSTTGYLCDFTSTSYSTVAEQDPKEIVFSPWPSADYVTGQSVVYGHKNHSYDAADQYVFKDGIGDIFKQNSNIYSENDLW